MPALPEMRNNLSFKISVPSCFLLGFNKNATFTLRPISASPISSPQLMYLKKGCAQKTVHLIVNSIYGKLCEIKKITKPFVETRNQCYDDRN